MMNTGLSIGTGIGIGVGDLQSAALREVARVMDEAKGNRAKAVALLLEKLHGLNIINDNDLRSLTKITQLGFKAGNGKGSAAPAYFEVRRIYDEMLASGSSSSTALAFASASAGSYETVSDQDGETTIIYKKSTRNWQDTLTAAGAVIGGAFGQPGLGAVIGGVVGKVVDECKD